MSSIFKRTYTKAIPANAEIIVRKGEKIARWKDRRGLVQTAPLHPSGDKVVIEIAEWHVAYVNAKGERKVAKGYTDLEATKKLEARLTTQASRAIDGLQTGHAGLCRPQPTRHGWGRPEASAGAVGQARKGRKGDRLTHRQTRPAHQWARQ